MLVEREFEEHKQNYDSFSETYNIKTTEIKNTLKVWSGLLYIPLAVLLRSK
jgi:hypothetical protein